MLRASWSDMGIRSRLTCLTLHNVSAPLSDLRGWRVMAEEASEYLIGDDPYSNRSSYVTSHRLNSIERRFHSLRRLLAAAMIRADAECIRTRFLYPVRSRGPHMACWFFLPIAPFIVPLTDVTSSTNSTTKNEGAGCTGTSPLVQWLTSNTDLQRYEGVAPCEESAEIQDGFEHASSNGVDTYSAEIRERYKDSAKLLARTMGLGEYMYQRAFKTANVSSTNTEGSPDTTDNAFVDSECFWNKYQFLVPVFTHALIRTVL